ncbi:MAG: hypothetical protein GX493_03650 [Firmicutes bacterium]|nr:hypothetical protein [Bacillota bacterium]
MSRQRGSGFTRDLLVLAVVGVVLASLFSMGIAAATDKYFARAVRSVIGDYGQYDLVFQVRTEFLSATERELARLAAERFPGSRLVRGPALAGKATIFWTFSSPYRTREVFENLSYYFGNLPGHAGFSIIAEPRLVVSGIPSGAQSLLVRELGHLPGVAFPFLDGDNLNLLLHSPQKMEAVRTAVRKVLARYRLVEIRFPAEEKTSLAEFEEWSGKLAASLRDLPGVSLAVDVTRGDTESEAASLSLTLSELRRFMTSYAARVVVEPADTVRLVPGERLVVQGLAPQPPVPGRPEDERFVVIQLESVANGRGEGIILRGDASYVNDVKAFRLLPEGIVGEYVGTVAVDDESAALAAALEEGIKLLRGLREVAVDPAWGETTGFLRDFQEITEGVTALEQALRDLQKGLAVATSAETQKRLLGIAAQIDAVSADLNRLATTVARVKMVEDRLATILDRIGVFQWFLRQRAAQYPGPEENPNGLGARLLAADRGLTALGEELRARARRIDDFLNRFNPFVQILLAWSERARTLAGHLASFGGVLGPGSEGEKSLASLVGATTTVAKRLRALEILQLADEAARAKEEFSFLAGIDFEELIGQLERVQASLPRLLDEEIGRSIGLIDRYLGGETAVGQSLRLMIDAKADRGQVRRTVHTVLGTEKVNLFWGPVGLLEPDFRGEILRLLAEVRTTITAFILVVLLVLEFIFDQSMVVAMLHRRTEAMLRRLFGRRPRLARLGGLVFHPARLYAAGFGAFWLGGSFALTGARLPMMGPGGILVLGGIIGLLLGFLAGRISPVDEEEVMAGESLGLSFGVIMREIVIPAGRPGLLAFLNRRHLVMRGGSQS